MAKKVPVTKFPDGAAVNYSRALEKMVEALGKETIALFDKYVAPEITIKQDAQYTKDGISDGIKSMLHSLKDKGNKFFDMPITERIASSFVKNVNRFNRNNLEQQMKVKGIDLVTTEPWLKDFLHTNITNNVGFIRSVHADYFERIENIVYDGVKSGASIKKMREQLMKEVGISKSKAQFIAVDQAGTILGQMTARRHQNLGIERFTWDTSGDERVRDSHRLLDGKPFSYDDPPTVNGRVVLPGEDYRCRCVALPVFDDEELGNIEGSVEPQEASTVFDPEKIMGETNMKEMVNEKNYNHFIEHLEKVEDNRTRNLYEKLGNKLSYLKVEGSKAYAINSQIQLTQASFDGNRYSNPLCTVYHENGHALDHLGLQVLTGEKSVPTGNKVRRKILRKTELVDEIIYHASGLPEYKLKETIERDLWEYVNGKELPMISDLGSKPRKKAEKEAYEMKRMEISRQSRANFSDFDKTMLEKYGRSSRQLAAISDIYESTPFTVNSHPFGIGHGKSYYKLAGTAEAEFFAHVSETITTDLESYELIKEIFPKSVEVWETIIDDILKAGDL